MDPQTVVSIGCMNKTNIILVVARAGNTQELLVDLNVLE